MRRVASSSSNGSAAQRSGPRTSSFCRGCRDRTGFGSAREELGYQSLDGAEIDRLGHVIVKAGVSSTLAIVFLPPTGDRDQERAHAPRLAAQPLRHFVTIHPRHADIEQYDAGPFATTDLQRLLAAVGNVG